MALEPAAAHFLTWCSDRHTRQVEHTSPQGPAMPDLQGQAQLLLSLPPSPGGVMRAAGVHAGVGPTLS
jgi:hypothetical protein